MNPMLAAIYGMNKTASAASDEIDLNQISAADYLAAVEAQGAEGEIDLNQISAAELLQYAEALESESEKTAGADDWYAVGRQMAAGFLDGMDKSASPDVIDLRELTAAEAIALVQSGEYEIVDEVEKTAGRMSSIMDAITAKGVRRSVGNLAETRGDKSMMGKARAYADTLLGRNASGPAPGYRAGRQSRGEAAATSAARRHAAGVVAAGAGLGAGGAGAAYYMKKKR